MPSHESTWFITSMKVAKYYIIDINTHICKYTYHVMNPYRYYLISLTLPVDLCLYTGFLIAWRIVCSRALPGEFKQTKGITQICYNQLDAPLKVWTELNHARSTGRVKEIGL